jgi:hypothetical protein
VQAGDRDKRNRSEAAVPVPVTKGTKGTKGVGKRAASDDAVVIMKYAKSMDLTKSTVTNKKPWIEVSIVPLLLYSIF